MMSDLIERNDAFDCLDNSDFDSYEDYSRTFDAIADIPAVNLWIQCADRLPKDHESVLVYFKEADQIREAEKVPARWYFRNGQIVPESKITHWMYLPSTPEVTST